MARSLHIFLIDDDENDRTLVRLAVRKSKQKHVLCTANGAKEAIQLLEEKVKDGARLPDLVLVDLRMPEMSGFEFLAWLNQHPRLRTIAAISFSGSNFESDVCLSYDLGARGFVRKPARFEDLVEKLLALLDFWSECAVPRFVI
jgi:CheY-like chemotaxis protein